MNSICAKERFLQENETEVKGDEIKYRKSGVSVDQCIEQER